jgi:hypothetical protein
VAAVSDFALIILTATDGSFAHEGMRPHRTNESSRMGSFGFWRMTGIRWVGAMLYRGLQSSSPDTLSKGCSGELSFLVFSRRAAGVVREVLEVAPDVASDQAM